MWPEVRRELLGMWEVLPLVQAKLVDDGEIVVASDATGSDQTGQAGVGDSYTRRFRIGRVLKTSWEDLRGRWAEQSWQVTVKLFQEHVPCQPTRSSRFTNGWSGSRLAPGKRQGCATSHAGRQYSSGWRSD